jgi:hypothetical protein
MAQSRSGLDDRVDDERNSDTYHLNGESLDIVLFPAYGRRSGEHPDRFVLLVTLACDD